METRKATMTKIEKRIFQSSSFLKTAMSIKKYKSQKPNCKTPSDLDMEEKKEKIGSTPKKETKTCAKKNKKSATIKTFLKFIPNS